MRKPKSCKGTDAVFNTLYKKLNPKQREAVDAIDGPVMVIAGPGTGKTTVLTLRIANILRRTDTPPECVLALTFTESGAREMRKKLNTIIGAAAYRVRVHTFHHLCNEIIKTYPEKFPRIVGSEHTEGLLHTRLLERVLAAGRYRILRPVRAPSYFVPKIIAAIQELKKDGVSPDALKKHAATAGAARRPQMRELAAIYRGYERALAKERLYDYEDMILEVVKRLAEDTDFRLRLQEEFQYILADEHQDANLAQNRLLELLSSFHKNPNLCIVGDEKQAIFRFQGASLENFLYFKKRFPRTTQITLKENYRSHQIILDAGHSLISHSPAPGKNFRLRLSARASHRPEKMRVISAPDEQSELAFLGSAIEQLRARGTALREIAIFVRDNAHAEAIHRELLRRTIPVARLADTDIFDHPYLAAFLTLLQAACNPEDDAAVGKAVFATFLGLNPVSVSRAVAKRARGAPLLDALAAHPETRAFTALLTRSARLARGEPLVEAFETIARESGFLPFILSHSRSHELLPLYAGLLQSITRFSERNKKAVLADFIEELLYARLRGQTVSAPYLSQDGVQLLTAHGAKGLEFDSVFIMHAEDGIWGGRRSRRFFALPSLSRADDDDTADERRLFYVALTRARKSVSILWSRQRGDGRERTPSRFIVEIDERYREEEAAPPFNAREHLTRRRTKTQTPSLKDKVYLNALFRDRGLSVTHLNNFLKCPWRYFFVDLIRLPLSQSPAALFGSAMHAALREYFEAYRRDEEFSTKQAAELFENHLFRTALPDADFREYARKGRREITRYLTHYDFPREIFNEVSIRGIPFQVGKTEILLNGKLDKVELQKGGVNVVDYKTGRPKSRNEIVGKTKDADGNYLRQLVFYKLLLDRYKKGLARTDRGGRTMRTGTIDFIESDKRGRFHREVFEVGEREVAELGTVITNSSRQILDLSFWNTRCTDQKCEWCRLRNSF